MKKKRSKKRTAIIVTMSLMVVALCGILSLVYFNIIDIPVLSNIFNLNSEKSEINKKANNIVNAFDAGDLSEISRIIFSENDIQSNVEFTDELSLVKQATINNNGILSAIFKKDKLSVSKIEEDCIVYKIKSPNMSGVFSQAASCKNENEVLNFLRDYANEANYTEYEVSVNYMAADGIITINYRTEAFINAITGGLVKEYNSLYMKALNDIKDKLEN